MSKLTHLYADTTVVWLWVEIAVVEMHEAHERRSPSVTDEQAHAAMVAWFASVEQACACANQGSAR